MSWKDLLQSPTETVVLPWTGGKRISQGPRSWAVSPLPREVGWYTFKLAGRTASVIGPAENPGNPLTRVKGFLIGDQIVLDGATGNDALKVCQRVHLVEEGLERFARIEAGKYSEDGPLYYVGQDMPCGVEDTVNDALLTGKTSLEGIKGVPAPLHMAFLVEVTRRAAAERRRQEAERRQKEEEERLAREEVQREVARRGGTPTSRRELAKTDFEAAARSALAVSGAELLETRRSGRPNEMIVRFTWLARRFECTCHAETLQIIDSGICLTAEYDDDDWEQGTKGDQYFTLESLPGVIREADNLGKLVVFRH